MAISTLTASFVLLGLLPVLQGGAGGGGRGGGGGCGDDTCDSSGGSGLRRRGWRWSAEGSCSDDLSLLLLQPSSPRDLEPGKPLDQLVEDAATVFRSCGVVAISSVLSAERMERTAAALQAELRPYAASRERVRDALLQAGRGHHRSYRQYKAALGALWEGGTLHHELMLSGGYTLRERSPGRVDLQLRYGVAPFNDTALTAGALVRRVVRRLLGEKARLKSMHGVVGLGGASEQEWHRDGGLLFASADDTAFSPANRPPEAVHARSDGVHLPPYAINVFFNLVPLTPTLGGTEFAPGSHQWGEEYSDEPCFRERTCLTRVFDELPVGSVVFSDYRTLHRGTANLGSSPRPLLMHVYGREWWSDTVNMNYGALDSDWESSSDRGGGGDDEEQALLLRHIDRATSEGAQPSVPQTSSQLVQREAAFWGLADLWEEGLIQELQQL